MCIGQGPANGSAITWKSSNAKVITDAADGDIAAGVVARQKTDTKLTLTATITDADGNTELSRPSRQVEL